jgi:hypothetical protein
MADLSASRNLEFVGEQEECSPKVTASVTYYKGGVLVLKPTTGYAAKPTDAANEEIAGIVTGVYEGGVRDDALAVGTTQIRAVLKKGKVWLPVSGCAQTDVGVIHYASEDQTWTKTAGTKTVGYRALDFKTGFLLFDLRKPDRIV